MPQYLLLLHEEPSTYRHLGADQMQATIQRYKRWMEGLRNDKRIVGGDKLRDGSGRVLRPEGPKVTVTDGPYSEVKEVIGGYFKVAADDYDHAVELAKSCPHIEFGTNEVREIEPT
jgi:hypothetical protein